MSFALALCTLVAMLLLLISSVTKMTAGTSYPAVVYQSPMRNLNFSIVGIFLLSCQVMFNPGCCTIIISLIIMMLCVRIPWQFLSNYFTGISTYKQIYQYENLLLIFHQVQGFFELCQVFAVIFDGCWLFTFWMIFGQWQLIDDVFLNHWRWVGWFVTTLLHLKKFRWIIGKSIYNFFVLSCKCSFGQNWACIFWGIGESETALAWIFNSRGWEWFLKRV